MTEFFTQPAFAAMPSMMFKYIHKHEWVEVGAELNPNGTWHGIWACELCPDIGIGGLVGPIPPGYCKRCGWVQQKKWPRKHCEECHTKFPTKDGT